MPKPDYFKMAVEITNLYIAGMKIGYVQGQRDRLAEGKKIFDKVMGAKNDK